MAGSLDVRFDTVRTLAFGSVGASYSAVGSRVTRPGRILKITNYLDAPIFVSFDGVNNNDFVPEKGFTLYDFSTNKSATSSEEFLMSNLTQVYVKRAGGAPTAGAVYVTYIYNPQ